MLSRDDDQLLAWDLAMAFGFPSTHEFLTELTCEQWRDIRRQIDGWQQDD